MATLEKIRSKSVLLIVVIGVALLAFIVGDALTNSRNLFGDTTTVAKVGGEKIDYHEYQRKREELNNQLEEARRQNPQQVAGFDAQTLSQMAIEQLVSEKLLDDAVDKAGIRASDNLLTFYVLNRPISPSMQTIVQQLNASGISASTPQQAHEVIFNPKRNGLTEAQMEPFQRAWLAMEEETRQLLRRQIYQRLVVNTVKANALDKKALYDDYVATSSVDFAFQPFGTLDEKKYPVSDSELKEAYNQEKNRFKVDEETKEISFIAVSVVPSEADRKAAADLARTAAQQLRDSSGSISKQLRKEGLAVERHNLLASAVPEGPVKTFLTSAPKDSVSIVSETLQGFSIIKMGSRSTAVDSVFVDVVQVAGANLPGKVLTALNAGLSIDSVPSRFSSDSVFVQANQGIALYGADGPTNAMQESQLDTLRKNIGRYITLVDSQDGALLARLVRQTSPKEVYEFEQVNYVLGPSSKTISDERAKLEKFLSANQTAKDFNANAAKAGYNVQKYVVSQSTPAIPRVMGMNYYYPDSRQVMRWVMIDGEAGQTSHIYESKDAVNPALYAVAVDEVYEDFMPVTNADVKSYLTDKVRRSKAGDDLVKQYKAKAQSLQSTAQAMGVEVQSAPTFRFGTSNGIGDGGVMGRIAGSAADKKVVVVKGQDGVYVYQVLGKNTEKFPYNEDVYEQQYYQFVNPQLGEMLKGNKKLENKVYKFEAGD